MRFNDFSTHSQTKPNTTVVPSRSTVNLEKPLKDLLMGFFGNTDSSIDY
jgi:hypothetical protein